MSIRGVPSHLVRFVLTSLVRKSGNDFNGQTDLTLYPGYAIDRGTVGCLLSSTSGTSCSSSQFTDSQLGAQPLVALNDRIPLTMSLKISSM